MYTRSEVPARDGGTELSTAAYWDRIARNAGPLAAVIDRRDRRGIKNLYIDLLQKIALSEVWNIKGSVLLDFGCGSGRFFSVTVGVAELVVGLEVSSPMLEHARQAGHNGRCELVLFDGKRLPFGENRFDAAMSVGCLQCLVDDDHFQNIVTQIVASVKGGGAIYLIEQVRTQNRAWQRTADAYRNAFARSGCICLQSYPIRSGRSLLLYAIRYGLIPQRWLAALARREIQTTRQQKPRPWVPYQDYLFVFSKP